MANLNLRISDYENAIRELSSHYSTLSNLLGQYQAAKGSVGDFYEGGQAESLSQDVQANIDKVSHAMEVTQKNIDNLTKVVEQYNTTENAVQQELQNAQDELNRVFS